MDAFPNEIFHGRVNNIHLNASTVQNVVTYDTVIDFENPDEILLPGETAYVTIPTGHAQECAANSKRGTFLHSRYAVHGSSGSLSNMPNNIRREAYDDHIGGWQVVWTLEARPRQQAEADAVHVGHHGLYRIRKCSKASLTKAMRLVTLQEGGSKNCGGRTQSADIRSRARGGGRGGR